MVKNNNFTKGVLAAMLLASPLASAKSDYPAADFQPKVLYSDSEYQHAESAPAKSAPAKKAKASDSRFPAADFQPKVLYSDSSYKHTKDTAVSSRSSAGSSASSVEAQPEGAATAEKGSDQTMLIGLIALAAVGFFFYKKGSAPQTASAGRSRPSAYAATGSKEGGLTGVAKYLADKEVKTATGVARYLESQEQTPATGVAKYMAKQVVAARQAAAERVTGVEKYLRNKG